MDDLTPAAWKGRCVVTSPGDMTWVRLVAGPDTQPADGIYNGRIVGFAPGTQAIGSGPDSPGMLLGIHGYPQPSPAGSGAALDFVMQGPLPPAAVDFIRNIPAGGWVDTTARQVMRQQVRRLVLDGYAVADALDVARLIHDAAVTNERQLPEAP
jgi:hypothetical protein